MHFVTIKMAMRSVYLVTCLFHVIVLNTDAASIPESLTPHQRPPIFENYEETFDYLASCGLPADALFAGGITNSEAYTFNSICKPKDTTSRPYAMCYMLAYEIYDLCDMYKAIWNTKPEYKTTLEAMYMEYARQAQESPDPSHWASAFCPDVITGFSSVQDENVKGSVIPQTGINTDTCISMCETYYSVVCISYGFMATVAGPKLKAESRQEKYPALQEEEEVKNKDQNSEDQAPDSPGDGNEKTEGDPQTDGTGGDAISPGQNAVIGGDGDSGQTGAQNTDIGDGKEDTEEDGPEKQTAGTGDGGAEENSDGDPAAADEDSRTVNGGAADVPGGTSAINNPAGVLNGPVDTPNGPLNTPNKIPGGDPDAPVDTSNVPVNTPNKNPGGISPIDTPYSNINGVPFGGVPGAPVDTSNVPVNTPDKSHGGVLDIPPHTSGTDNDEAPYAPVDTVGDNGNSGNIDAQNTDRGDGTGDIEEGGPDKQSDEHDTAGDGEEEKNDGGPDVPNKDSETVDGDADNGLADSPGADAGGKSGPDEPNQDEQDQTGNDNFLHDNPDDGGQGGDGLDPAADSISDSPDYQNYGQGIELEDPRDSEEDYEDGDINQHPPPEINEEQPQQQQQVEQNVRHEFEEEESSHFLAYSLTAIILILATYILYHNKQKIIAVVIEGRNGKGRRRRGGKTYQKLDQNISEAMPSLHNQHA